MTLEEYEKLYDLLSDAIADQQDTNGNFAKVDHTLNSIAFDVFSASRLIASRRAAHLRWPDYTDINGFDTDKKKEARARALDKRTTA